MIAVVVAFFAAAEAARMKLRVAVWGVSDPWFCPRILTRTPARRGSLTPHLSGRMWPRGVITRALGLRGRTSACARSSSDQILRNQMALRARSRSGARSPPRTALTRDRPMNTAVKARVYDSGRGREEAECPTANPANRGPAEAGHYVRRSRRA